MRVRFYFTFQSSTQRFSIYIYLILYEYSWVCDCWCTHMWHACLKLRLLFVSGTFYGNISSLLQLCMFWCTLRCSFVSLQLLSLWLLCFFSETQKKSKQTKTNSKKTDQRLRFFSRHNCHHKSKWCLSQLWTKNKFLPLPLRLLITDVSRIYTHSKTGTK